MIRLLCLPVALAVCACSLHPKSRPQTSLTTAAEITLPIQFVGGVPEEEQSFRCVFVVDQEALKFRCLEESRYLELVPSK